MRCMNYEQGSTPEQLRFPTFPVLREAVIRTLESLDLNPEPTMFYTAQELSVKHRPLTQFIGIKSYMVGQPDKPHLAHGYLQGAYYTFLTLKSHAELTETGEIPRLSKDHLRAYIKWDDEKRKETGKSTYTNLNIHEDEVFLGEEALAFLRDEVTHYQPFRRGFTEGMIDIYLPYKHGAEFSQYRSPGSEIYDPKVDPEEKAKMEALLRLFQKAGL